MNAQRIWLQRDKARGKPPFAIRIFEDHATEPIKADSKIVPLPEFGAMAFNIERGDGLLVRSFNLAKPQLVAGIKATQRAEVWRTLNKQPQRLIETWFAVRTPKDHATLADFIRAYSREDSRQSQTAKQNPEIIVAKSQRREPVDVRASAKDAALRLLEKEFPQTFKVINTKSDNGTICKAYVADMTAKNGRAPDAEGLDVLLRDSGFVRWLSAALARPGNASEPWKWQLALGWIRDGLHALDDKELAAAMNERTGLKLKAGAWRARAKRLKLVSSVRIGRPENLNFLPPQ